MENQQTTTEYLDSSIDVALNTWAVSVQLSILMVFSVVFLSLWSHFPRRDISFWLVAWVANLTALLAIFAVLSGTGYLSGLTLKAIYLIYALSKIWFAIFLIIGLSRHLNRLDVFSRKIIQRIAGLTGFAALAMLFSAMNTLHIQIVVYLMVGSILLIGGSIFLIKKNFHSGWVLPAVLCLEGLVFLHHGSVLVPTLWGEAVPRYMTRISFFDSISELIVGITCVLAISNRVIKEVQNRNLDLEQAQQNLRELVDEDPLTQLWNRRKLDTFIKEEVAGQATLLYIDVDKFKQINDQWGHAVGDSCLTRIADSMRHHFKENTGLFRLGGDEFLVVIYQQSGNNVTSLIKNFKASLAVANKAGPAIELSIGIQEMADEKNFKEALKAADEAMYESKPNHSN